MRRNLGIALVLVLSLLCNGCAARDLPLIKTSDEYGTPVSISGEDGPSGNSYRKLKERIEALEQQSVEANVRLEKLNFQVESLKRTNREQNALLKELSTRLTMLETWAEAFYKWTYKYQYENK